MVLLDSYHPSTECESTHSSHVISRKNCNVIQLKYGVIIFRQCADPNAKVAKIQDIQAGRVIYYFLAIYRTLTPFMECGSRSEKSDVLWFETQSFNGG